MPRSSFRHLQLIRPRMLDLIISKMGRGDAQDIGDVCTMLVLDPVKHADLARASATARIPAIYAELFPNARDRILAAVEAHEIISRPGLKRMAAHPAAPTSRDIHVPPPPAPAKPPTAEQPPQNRADPGMEMGN